MMVCDCIHFFALEVRARVRLDGIWYNLFVCARCARCARCMKGVCLHLECMRAFAIEMHLPCVHMAWRAHGMCLVGAACKAQAPCQDGHAAVVVEADLVFVGAGEPAQGCIWCVFMHIVHLQ